MPATWQTDASKCSFNGEDHILEPQKVSFENVADFCERHIEALKGREIGMTFGAIIRALGRLAAIPARLSEQERAARAAELNREVERLLAALSARALPTFYQGKSIQAVDPLYIRGLRPNMVFDASGMGIQPASSYRPTMTYDTGQVPLIQPSRGRTTMSDDSGTTRKE
jgi:hypothetical protein